MENLKKEKSGEFYLTILRAILNNPDSASVSLVLPISNKLGKFIKACKDMIDEMNGDGHKRDACASESTISRKAT